MTGPDLASLAPAPRLRAFRFGQILLAQPDARGGYFQEFVLGHYFKPPLDGELVGGNKVDGLIGSRSANVGQLLAFGRIHHHLLALGGIADHHPFIDINAGADVERAALLQVPERISDRSSGCHRNHGTRGALVKLARMGPKSEHARGKNPFSSRVDHELPAIPEEPPRRPFERKLYDLGVSAHIL